MASPRTEGGIFVSQRTFGADKVWYWIPTTNEPKIEFPDWRRTWFKELEDNFKEVEAWCLNSLKGQFYLSRNGIEIFLEEDAILFYMNFK